MQPQVHNVRIARHHVCHRVMLGLLIQHHSNNLTLANAKNVAPNRC